LVELFDAHGVSFVSVTQQFNTTTSMGRLTLNVLLSFARCRGARRPHRRHREVLVPERSSPAQVLPIRSDTRTKLVTAIALGRQWLSEIETGTATIDSIATRRACSKRHVHMTISLAFLAPSLVKAAVEGRLPHRIGVARVFDAPVAWSRQYQMLGLAQ
jgi:site-specific DNA recombinase